MLTNLSEQVKMHLQWIGEAARNNQLAALRVTERDTGKEVTALVIVIDDPGTESYEMYPMGILTEDVGEFMDKYNPPEGAEGYESETGTSGEGTGNSHASPPDADEEV